MKPLQFAALERLIRILFVIAASGASSIASETRDLIILSGQSNAVGFDAVASELIRDGLTPMCSFGGAVEILHLTVTTAQVVLIGPVCSRNQREFRLHATPGRQEKFHLDLRGSMGILRVSRVVSGLSSDLLEDCVKFNRNDASQS